MWEFSPTIKVCDAYFRMTDPAPYIALKIHAMQRRLSRSLCFPPQSVPRQP